MATLTFDTHAYIKKLTAAGMPEQQAETVTAMVREVGGVDTAALATKADLKAELAETKYDILKWVFGAIVAQTAFLSLIKFFGH
jgi:hypothetical protein